ncbi:HEPN domain-containing protein [Rubrivivax gelatinosus]|uniref:RiboL-PSP-HEPN domain-containing protein n=1 Tax=Rubrivivax gelatinosus TaxID=28068 RepID=A0A4R2MJA0_RUBGE|nr:HEPN domain-containing protein [Rubrivivax gelatinosus]TCP05385.1 hypothetical protein EV684_101257 [Rubrivivax gelatinosus]
MDKLSWAALRHVEALRESVAFTLRGGAIGLGTKRPESFYDEWLSEQGVKPVHVTYVAEGRSRLDMVRSMEESVREHGIDLLDVQLAGARSRFSEQDIGVERSSIGWARLPNFITSSAFVRLLGAMEQFEIDVLKTLLHYRPEGKGYVPGDDILSADLSVPAEAPDKDDRYSKPALWSWLRKPAENTVERRKIFKSVFEIDCYPASFSGKTSSEIRSYYQSMYDRRNAIAHGRKLVEISLSEYCEAEAFVLSLVKHLASVCSSRYRLSV